MHPVVSRLLVHRAQNTEAKWNNVDGKLTRFRIASRPLRLRLDLKETRSVEEERLRLTTRSEL